MTKNVFKYGILALMMLITVAMVASPAAADPVMTRTLNDSTIAPGDTVHVTLNLTGYLDEQALNSLQEDYSAPEMAGWTVSNVLLPPELDAYVITGGVIHDFSRDFMSGAMPAGDYTVEYDLTVDLDTSYGAFDLTGAYIDSGNAVGYFAVGDTQLIVARETVELYNDTVSLYPEDRNDAGALDATSLAVVTSDSQYGLSLDSIDGHAKSYGATPEESVGWSIWLNDELTPLGIGQNAVVEGDVVKYTYNSYTGPMWDPNVYDQQYVVIVTVHELVPPAPTVDFEVDVASGDAPLTVQFTDLSTDVHAGTYAWDFDNDGNVDSTDQNPAYVYNTPGTYSVNLTVTNEGGSNTTMKADFITANMPPMPVAIFEADVTLGAVPMAVNFTDLSTNATSWAWDFDNDGIVDSTNQNPAYTYNTAGIYTVNLTVTNLAGANTSLDTVEAVELPVADFEANVTSSTSAPLTVKFNDTSTGGEATAWAWDFDNDGIIDSTDQNPVYTYNNTGVYTVNLTVTNAVATDDEIKVDYISIVKPSSRSRSSSSSSSGGSARIISAAETPVPPVEEVPEEVIEEETAVDNSKDGDSPVQDDDDSGSQGDAEYKDPEEQESDPDTPGFEMIFAVLGLLMSVYLAKRH